MIKPTGNRMLFSVCDLQVFGYFLERTLEPLDGPILPIRNIIYGTGSRFTVETSNDISAYIKDDNENKFLISIEKMHVLFEVI